MQYIYIHHTVPTCLQCLLQYEIGKSGLIEADCCNIIVGHGKVYNKRK